MKSTGPRSLLDGLVGACVSVLLAAVALYIAVGLIKAIWPILLLVGLVGGSLVGGVALLRTRHRGW